MKSPFVMAMTRVLLIYVAVATAELFVEGGFVDCAGTDVVGKCCGQD